MVLIQLNWSHTPLYWSDSLLNCSDIRYLGLFSRNIIHQHTWRIKGFAMHYRAILSGLYWVFCNEAGFSLSFSAAGKNGSEGVIVTVVLSRSVFFLILQNLIWNFPTFRLWALLAVKVVGSVYFLVITGNSWAQHTSGGCSGGRLGCSLTCLDW